MRINGFDALDQSPAATWAARGTMRSQLSPRWCAAGMHPTLTGSQDPAEKQVWCCEHSYLKKALRFILNMSIYLYRYIKILFLWARCFQFILWTFSMRAFEPQRNFTSIYKKNHRFFLKTKKVRDNFRWKNPKISRFWDEKVKIIGSMNLRAFFNPCLPVVVCLIKVQNWRLC